MIKKFDILIVGAGHGGAQAAIALRHRKFEGTIGMIGDEGDLPYDRPPLSKEYFSGEKGFERILIRPEKFWVEREITMLLGRRVVAVDPVLRTVILEDGATIGYGALIWATGGTPRRLDCAGYDLGGLHSVRTRHDVDQILSQLDRARTVVVIGGGYIGLEAAAGLIRLGKRVTIVEALDRVLARVAGKTLSRFYEAEHRARGIDVRLSAKVTSIIGTDANRISAVALASGEVLPADMAIVGIGIIPSVEPLIAAGAAGKNGVQVDALCRTSLPDIFAIGDCALHPNPFANGAVIRLESVQNANDQAITVAKQITGTIEPYNSVPWFWSKQYDLSLQTVGLSLDHDDAVMRGDPLSRSFSIIYLKHGKVIALDCVNRAQDFAQGRALVIAGTRVDRRAVADPATPLKSLLCSQDERLNVNSLLMAD